MITRAQKVRYAICRGFDDNFIKSDLNFNIDNATKLVLSPIEVLNKYVHLDEKTFNISSSIGEDMVGACINALHEFLLNINKFIFMVEQKYEMVLYNHLVEIIAEETFDELDILSTHTRIEDIILEKVTVKSIGAVDIEIEINGGVSVELQYGNDKEAERDGTVFNESYSFDTIYKTVSVLAPLDISIDVNEITFDTSDFYSDGDEEDLDLYDYEIDEFDENSDFYSDGDEEDLDLYDYEIIKFDENIEL